MSEPKTLSKEEFEGIKKWVHREKKEETEHGVCKKCQRIYSREAWADRKYPGLCKYCRRKQAKFRNKRRGKNRGR